MVQGFSKETHADGEPVHADRFNLHAAFEPRNGLKRSF
jgi:hypothetical protein